MQNVSTLYQEIYDSGKGWFEVCVTIGGVDYYTDMLKSVKISGGIFGNDGPSVGGCVSAEIDITMREPEDTLPRMAEIVPWYRITDGTRSSEWLKKGLFYIDTREQDRATGQITIHGYDAMLKAEQAVEVNGKTWPIGSKRAVNRIAEQIGVRVDDRTLAVLTDDYSVEIPSGYSCREVLGYIAAMYAGNFIMSDEGKLLLVSMLDSVDPNSVLCDENGVALLVGGDNILV